LDRRKSVPGLLIHGARQVLTLRGATGPRRGSALRNLSIIEDGSILIEDGKIRDVGPTRRLENLAVAKNVPRISARGRVVMPGFTDCHMRLITPPGEQARSLHQAPAWKLAADAAATLRRCLRYGTTTLEVKCCDGLDSPSETKVLRVLADLGKQQAIDLVVTHCGGQGVAADWEGDADSYIEHLVTRTLPQLREKGQAAFVAVSCDQLNGVSSTFAISTFDDRQRRTILEAAARLSLPVKIQTKANGVGLAIEYKASAVEHLEKIPIEDMGRLADSETIAVLMPAHGFHHPESGYAPARDLIARGAAVALASGYDRVTSPSFSMPIAVELACRRLGMAPAEAIVAATLNSAYAAGRGRITGSIEPGKNADLLILETSDYRDLAYETGVNPVDIAIIRGEIACQNSVSYGPPACLPTIG
jgi:imidazolonepropionase